MNSVTDLLPQGALTPPFNQLSAWLGAAIAALPRLAIALGVLFVTMLVPKGVRSLMRRNLIDVLQLLNAVALWLIGGLIAVTVVFPTVTPAPVDADPLP